MRLVAAAAGAAVRNSLLAGRLALPTAAESVVTVSAPVAPQEMTTSWSLQVLFCPVIVAPPVPQLHVPYWRRIVMPRRVVSV